MRKSTLITGGVIAAALVIGTGGGAYAAAKITGADIVNGSITGTDIKNGSLGVADLSGNTVLALKGAKGDKGDKGDPGTNGTNGTNGSNGAAGKDGKDNLLGAYYATAVYDLGNTNEGAIATVACEKTTDVALSGGVQMIGLGGKNSAVGSSFPGRMDWDTNTPKADRLDGWIVQFDARVAPEKVTLWALCVPGATIPVHNTYTQSS